MSDIITITGTIGTELDHKRTPNGLVITSFRLVSSQRYRDRDTNSWIEGDPSWYSVSIFRVLAENAFASLRKGERVIVTGKLRVREWETSAKKGITAEIEADSIGHDLLFGTTRFEKNRKTGAVATDSPSPNEAAPDHWEAPIADGDAVGWANPGVATSETPAPHINPSANRDTDERMIDTIPELELASAETPF